MITVGITGGIGSGKTIITRIFSMLGIAVYNADFEAKEMYHRPDVKEELKKSFGKKILSSSGKPDNKRIADLIFNDEKSLKLINALIHPLVQEYFHEWRKKQSSPYVLKEAAILFESGSYKDCDKIILVTAPAEVRIQRILQRDKRTRKEVIEIMSHQWTDEKKIKHSDFVIVNDETELVIPQVLIINNELLKLSIKA